MDKLTRIAQLIALSGSSNENEARNASVQACKLIREGGFQVCSPGAFNSEDIGEVRDLDDFMNEVTSVLESVTRFGKKSPFRTAYQAAVAAKKKAK